MVFEYVLAQKGIDKKDVNINQSIDFGSTAAAFSGGQGDYTIEFEPSATLLEQKGDGYVVASVGTESGYVPYTSYSVKQSYLKTHGATVEKIHEGTAEGNGLRADAHTGGDCRSDCAAVCRNRAGNHHRDRAPLL